MAKDTALEDARARQLYRQEKARREIADGLDEPTIVDAIPGYGGLLPISAIDQPVKIEIPPWEPVFGWEPGDSETLFVYLKDGASILWTSTPTGVQLPNTVPVPVPLPVERIPAQGTYQVDYRVIGWNGNDKTSLPAPVIIDRQPPYYHDGGAHTPKALILPAAVIDDAYLLANSDQVVCQVPPYPEKARGDLVYLYWGPTLPDTVNAPPVVPPVEIPDDSQVEVAVTIPGDEIRKRNDGITYAVYWLSDKAGNVSGISLPQTADVQLGPLPANLKPPRVPLDPLSRADALEPVEVEIDVFDNPNKAVIKVLWDDIALNALPVGPNPVFPLRVAVPWSTLKARYDFSGPEEQQVTVGYQAWRGSLAFPDSGPLSVDVTVDLSIVGPDNPDEPNPVNPNLPLAVLTSSSGQTNRLESADKGADADVQLLLHEDPVDGEIIDLYWRDVRVDTQTLSGTPAEGDPVDFTLAWTHIDLGGNDPRLPMTYTIRAGNGMNPQRSPTTEVDVDVVTIDLDEPSFPTIDDSLPNPIINCSSLDCDTQDLPLFIPGDSRYLQDGMTLKIESQGYESDQITEVPGTDFLLNYQLKPGEAANGATVRITPYTDKLLPIETGRLKAWYTVTINGADVRSVQASKRISLGLPGGGFCPVVPC